MTDQCFECEDPADVMHHVVPVHYGGTRALPLCTSCHDKVHGKDGEDRVSLSVLIKSALDQKKENREYLGRPRFGFFLDPKSKVLTPHEQEQEIIRKVSELRSIGVSYAGIHRTLVEERMFGRRGVPPGVGTIYRMIQRPDLFSRTAESINPPTGAPYKRKTRKT